MSCEKGPSWECWQPVPYKCPDYQEGDCGNDGYCRSQCGNCQAVPADSRCYMHGRPDPHEMGYGLGCALSNAYDSEDRPGLVLSMADVRFWIMDQGYPQPLPADDSALYRITCTHVFRDELASTLGSLPAFTPPIPPPPAALPSLPTYPPPPAFPPLPAYPPLPVQIRAIETSYRGCRFRSRLEARWAVFFDTLGIKWTYEPERFAVGNSSYLPDFLLETGTWIEVKGDEQRVDKDYLIAAARELPQLDQIEWPGPKLLILGNIPEPRTELRDGIGPCCGKTAEENRQTFSRLEGGDWGWIGLELTDPEGYLPIARYGFGFGWCYPQGWQGGHTIPDSRQSRPARLPPYTTDQQAHLASRWTEPTWYPGEFNCAYGYAAARSARFEHGQEGAYRY